ncbi:hypothetical protein ACEPPN_016790 [Leptodophora sp. 'Broadleaf-Isolate-01']
MEPSRSSKRVQGLAPDGSQNSKRRPKPNTNSLPAFEELHGTQTRQIAPTKRRRAKTTESDAKNPAPDPATSSPQAQRQKTSAGGPDQEVVDVTSSPAQIRTPTTALIKKPSVFDPKVLFDKEPQNVGFNIWPIINKSKQHAIVKNWDINSVSDRITYKRLCEVIWRMAVEPWTERRSLLSSEKPIRQAFEFLFGNPKTPTLTLDVRDQETFDDAMVPLRIYKHKRMTSANEITINAYYKTPEDLEISGSDDERSTGKGKKRSKGKSKADKARDTVRPTPLGRENSEIDALDSDPFSGILEDDEGAEPRTSPTPRDSVTRRMLDAKRQKEKEHTPEEVTRAEIFHINNCVERLCNNKKKCCYVMKRAGTHHAIDIKRQQEWAAMINAKAPGVTKTQPPAEWLVDFAEGALRTNYKPKLTGARKADQTIVETTAKVDESSSSIDKLTQLLLLQTVQNMTNQVPTPAVIPTFSGTPGPSTASESHYPGQSNRPQVHTNPPQNPALGSSGHTFIPPPSSPLKPLDDDENEVELMGQWMVQKEKNSKRREQLSRGFELMEKAFVMDVSQLRDVPFITSLDIPAGIAHYIKDHVSKFKKVYKENRYAAVDLINFSSGAIGRQDMPGAGSSEDVNDPDFFVDY